MPTNPDAGIGVVKVVGKWEASSLAAGVNDAMNDGFGRNDLLIAGETPSPEIFAAHREYYDQGFRHRQCGS